MPEQPTLVLIHGHGVDASIWDGVCAVSLFDGPTLRPDFSKRTDLANIDAYAHDLHRQLQTANARKVVLVGHSMGGYIALAFAEQYPEMVSGLVLFHSTAYADDDAKKEQRKQTIQALQTEGAAPFIEKTIPKMVAPGFSPEIVQQLVDTYRTLPANALAAGMQAIANRPDRTHLLRDARFPVLVILGKQDQLIAYDKTRTLANFSTKVNVATMETAGHLGMIEQIDEAARLLSGFVQ
ncbi:alpha/beta fold hydrolase [Spirosoma montaniterrae]|uniref:Alpha/beta hydrolase n=1 Tax=Spirosoma montaniterrae TaxID=1178516 RepID=A0A1P9WSL8_9BACT|nr:alpha/beta hydrolase [Spirosoma montaniterrae]AQG78381.1 alpha/beta hydrolase [Spirosoma montaniterrae]